MALLPNARALLVVAAAAAIGGCAGASTNPITPLTPSRATVTQSVASTAGYTFSPASPLSMSLNTTVNVTIRESKYRGTFKVTGCSAPGGQCGRAKYGHACWTRSTPDDINSITAQIKASPTMIMTEYAAGQYFPSVTCYFTIKDSKGRTAVYEAYAPAI
jgi:hypothetical protein